jgi:hypothetical protein
VALPDAQWNAGVMTRTLEQTQAEASNPRLPALGVNVALRRGAFREAAADKAPAGLGWNQFSGRYFPGHRRHDFTVLRAYQEYLRDSSQLPGAPPATAADA